MKYLNLINGISNICPAVASNIAAGLKVISSAKGPAGPLLALSCAFAENIMSKIAVQVNKVFFIVVEF
jgi:hypothetical protein